MTELNPPVSNHKLQQALKFLRGKIPKDFHPEVAIVLGSGLSRISEKVKSPMTIPYRDVPGLEGTSVPGHQGLIVLGVLNGKKVLLLSGRKHFYEGVPMSKIVFPVRLAALLGIRKIVLVSAVGAMNKKYRPGDFVVVKDHLNLMGTNPLIGEEELAFGERFLDLSDCYNSDLKKATLRAAKKLKIRCHSGVYTSVAGPVYETPSEIRGYRKLGGDVVGMSMVPEAIAAHQMGVKVLGLCLVTNMASGISKKKLSHEEVLETGIQVSQKSSALMQEILNNI